MTSSSTYLHKHDFISILVITIKPTITTKIL